MDPANGPCVAWLLLTFPASTQARAWDTPNSFLPWGPCTWLPSAWNSLSVACVCLALYRLLREPSLTTLWKAGVSLLVPSLHCSTSN